jgi:hypothetical protein
MGIKENFRRAFWGAAVLLIAAHIALAKSGGKEIFIAVSWGDQIGNVGATGETPLLTSESFRKLFHEYKEAGVDTVLFRVDVLRWVRDCDWPEPKALPAFRNAPPGSLEAKEKQWVGAHEAVGANLLKSIVDIAHQEGLKIFAYSTTFDEGMPLNEVLHVKGNVAGTDPQTGKLEYFTADMKSDLVSKFVEAHPECVMVDRSQTKHNWGTLEFAYPQARDYAVGYNRWFLEQYPFDGIYITFRNEFSFPEFGDEFGFASPIVDEYERRYGVNILREEFDVEKWRRLCGEYLTQFIRELQMMVHSRGKMLLVGIPQGNYMGLPNGNMYIDWQGWAQQQIVDGLVIGVYTGKFLFPDRVGYGYLTDMEFDIGLPNLLWDLQNNYWPLCAKYRVKLYDDSTRGRKTIPLAEVARTHVDGLCVSDSAFSVLKEWLKLQSDK